MIESLGRLWDDVDANLCGKSSPSNHIRKKNKIDRSDSNFTKELKDLVKI